MLEVSLSVSYEENTVINGLSFTLNDGEILGITGINGSGKSSLALAIAQLLSEGTVTGSVCYNSAELSSLSVADLRKTVGIVTQDFDSQIFTDDVISEIAFGMENLNLDRQTMMVRMDEILNKLEIPYLKNKLIRELSEGEKALVVIASVMVMRPKILILDEAFAPLDEGKKDVLTRFLKEFCNGGGSVLLVTHSESQKGICDRILDLDKGIIL